MFELPPAARMTVWGNAVLVRATSLDEAAFRIVGGDPPHRVAGLPGEPSSVALSLALGRLRAVGVTALRLVLPVPGDAAGLPGPPAFNQLAVSARAAVLGVGGTSLALLNEVRSSWIVCDTAPAPVYTMSVDDAERMLRHELREGTEELLRLDVARWQPEAGELIAQHSRAHDALPQCYPAGAAQVLALAQRLGSIVEIGARTEGAAISARQMAKRRDVFARLDAAVRRATEAACNAVT